MGIDYSLFAIPKVKQFRIEAKREKRLTNREREKLCREAVWRLYGRKCNVPGCREQATEQHHIVYRSRSVKLKFEPTNRAPLCKTHHDLLHLGKIEIRPRTADGELVVIGERKYLEFKL